MTTDSEERRPLAMSLSVQMKINLENYENATVFLSLQGVTEETTEDEIIALLTGPGRMSYNLLKDTLQQKLQSIRKEKGD